MVGFLVFVSLAALFMTVVSFSVDPNTTDKLLAWGLCIALWIAAWVFARGLYRALFARSIALRRWSKINQGLFGMGFRGATSGEVDQTARLPVQLMAPYTLAEQRGGGIDHVTVGTFRGREVRCCNVRLRGGGWVDVPAVVLRAEASFAPTVIRPRGKVEIPPRPDMERVRFEHERFNRSIAVYSTDPFFASAMVDARMMEWLRNNLDGVQLELSDRWAVVWFLPHRGRRRGPRELLDVLTGFDEKIPRALPSLFPGRRSHVMWRGRK